jgi:hypothetical protein
MYIKQRVGWVNTTGEEITIGVRNVHISDLEKYYRAIHPYDTFTYRVSRYLCTVGLEEVLRIQVFNRQAEVDKVFFEAITNTCEAFLVDWVSDWKEVYKQFAASKAPFRDLIIDGGYCVLSSKQYRKIYIEVGKMKTFFRILNMRSALQMLRIFTDNVLWICLERMNTLPDVYPFALKGKPIPEVPAGTVKALPAITSLAS